jgi:hypothetical protein
VAAARKEKKRRGERARRRQRPRPGQHDLREQYHEGDLPSGRLSVLTIPDPYSRAGHVDAEGNLQVAAELKQARHADGSVAEGAPGWTPPRRPLITVIADLRSDALGRMWVRRQISEPQFLAGRRYQTCHDAAEIGSVHSVRLDQPYVSGCQLPDPLTDRQRVAAAKLRAIEAAVRKRNGANGAWLVRTTLGERYSPETAARMAGATTAREVRMCCQLLYRCLTTIAVAVGLQSSSRRAYQPQLTDGRDPGEDLARHADASELMDPRLRRGRVNGRA